MQSANRICLASAGSGKTTNIVREACQDVATRSVLVTYTINGRSELENNAYEQFAAVPPNVTISTWYTFILSHFVRPYQNHLYEPRVSTINFNRIPEELRRIPKWQTKNFFFSSSGRIWKDRVTDFACQLIEKTDGLPIKRLERIFSRIFIDEAQDLSGWDLELIELLLKSKTQVVLVGDHHQATYATNDNRKNLRYLGENIVQKFVEWEKQKLASIEYHAHSHRCLQPICDFADALFPDSPKTKSLNVRATDHDGIFLVSKGAIKEYCRQYAPKPLRWNKSTNVLFGEPLNFGDAKGMTFDRTIIYPHAKFLEYVKTGVPDLEGSSKSKTYVALTRASQSVAIVVPDGFKPQQPQFFKAIT